MDARQACRSSRRFVNFAESTRREQGREADSTGRRGVDQACRRRREKGGAPRVLCRCRGGYKGFILSSGRTLLLLFCQYAPSLSALTIPEIVQEGKALEDKLVNLKDQLLDLRSGHLSQKMIYIAVSTKDTILFARMPGNAVSFSLTRVSTQQRSKTLRQNSTRDWTRACSRFASLNIAMPPLSACIRVDWM